MKRFLFFIISILSISQFIATKSLQESFAEMSVREAPYYPIRQELFSSFQNLDVVSKLGLIHQCDTFFIDESYSDDGTFLIMTWNIKTPDSLTLFNTQDFEYLCYYHLKKEYIDLIAKWDTLTLKILGGPSRSIPQLGIYRSGTGYHILTRIIVNGGDYSWESCEFWEPMFSSREALMKLYFDSINKTQIL